MKLQNLKSLADKEIIRMRELYERAGFTSNQMNGRLHRMTGTLSQEETRAFEEAAIELIGELVETLDLPKDKLAHFLNIEINYDKNPWYPHQRVEPLAVVEAVNTKFELFLLQDRFVAKQHFISGSEVYYRTPKAAIDIINNRPIKLTNRGRAFIQAYNKSMKEGEEFGRLEHKPG